MNEEENLSLGLSHEEVQRLSEAMGKVAEYYARQSRTTGCLGAESLETILARIGSHNEDDAERRDQGIGSLF